MSDDECGHQRMVAQCWGCYRKDLATLLARAQAAESELARKEEALARALEFMRAVPCQRVPKDPSKPCEWCLFLTKQS